MPLARASLPAVLACLLLALCIASRAAAASVVAPPAARGLQVPQPSAEEDTTPEVSAEPTVHPKPHAAASADADRDSTLAAVIPNDSPYCKAARGAAGGLGAACAGVQPSLSRVTCAKVHQALCVDGAVNLQLTCLHAIDLYCTRLGAQGTAAHAACVAAERPACVDDTEDALVPRELKCASDGAGHFVVCQPAANGLNLYPCNQYLEKACGGPAFRMVPIGCVRPCYRDCRADGRQEGSPALEQCRADCRDECAPAA